jgi:hypothetical protein
MFFFAFLFTSEIAKTIDYDPHRSLFTPSLLPLTGLPARR